MPPKSVPASRTSPPDSGDIALYEDKAGFARPELTVQAHLALAEQAGATLQFGEQVLEWAETAAGVTVQTDRGTYTAGQLVICPGAWAPQLLAEFGIPITVERQVLYWLDPQGGAPRRSSITRSSSTRVPTVCRSTGSPPSTARGGAASRSHSSARAWCAPPTPSTAPCTTARSAKCVSAQQNCFPCWTGRACTRRRACTRTPPISIFVIARHPGSENVTVACGFSGHGFKFVPVVGGEILADLAITGSTAHPISLFDPPRRLVTT